MATAARYETLLSQRRWGMSEPLFPVALRGMAAGCRVSIAG
jgi:hypothetical protein